jgi:PD-(D/E)XK nuclease superfamily
MAMRRTDKPDIGRLGMISASEIAAFAYCPEQWRLQYGMGLEPEYRAALDAGTRHHARKAVAEQLAGGAITLGRILAVLAALVLLLLLWRWL